MPRKRLTHLNANGAARMVDVTAKPVTCREAIASVRVQVGPEALDLISSGRIPKGDVFAVARIAGIQAAKRTAELIPLCHTLPLEAVELDLTSEPPDTVLITATARTTAQTGVEMEALTAAAVAALTVYDMCKSVSRDMTIGPLQLERKSGGRSGTYRRRP